MFGDVSRPGLKMVHGQYIVAFSVPFFLFIFRSHCIMPIYLQHNFFHQNAIECHSAVIEMVVMNCPLPYSLGTVGVSRV